MEAIQRGRHDRLSLFSLSWPIFVENLLRFMLGTVHVFLLSNYSDDVVAAVGVANQLVNIFLTIISIVSTGTSIIICQYLGYGDEKMATKVATVSITTNLAFGGLLSVVGALCAEPLLNLMNLPAELMPYGRDYLSVVGGAMFLQALISTASAVIRSYGHTRFSMLVAVIMNIINAACTYVVVFRPLNFPDLGVRGVAYAQVISLVFSAAISLWFVFGRLHASLNVKEVWNSALSILKQVYKIGIPAAVEGISYTGSQAVSTYLIGFLGATALSTRVYVQNIVFFVEVMSMSIGEGALIKVGRLVGEGNEKEARRLGKTSGLLALGANLAVSLFLFALRRPIIGLYTDDTVIIELFCNILIIDIVVELGRALNHVYASFLRGVGDVRYPVAITMISTWGISVTLTYVFGIVLDLGLMGVWMAFIVDEWCRGLILWRRYRSGKWLEKTLIRKTQETPAA